MIPYRRQAGPIAVSGVAAWMFALALSGCTHGRAVRWVHVPEPDAGMQTQARYRVERIGMRIGTGSVMYLPASWRSFAPSPSEGMIVYFQDRVFPSHWFAWPLKTVATIHFSCGF